MKQSNIKMKQSKASVGLNVKLNVKHDIFLKM